jgi:dipeptidyl aminopeptidase/acylaminoacyl peptidase
VWNFHGAKDPVVPIEESEVLVNTLQECGGDVRFTIYPDAQHDAWTQTYENPELYEWFLSHLK